MPELVLARGLVVALVCLFLALGVAGAVGLSLWVRQELRVVLAHRRYKRALRPPAVTPRIRGRI